MRSLFDVKIDPTKDKEILNALDEIDLNGDGKFDFEEFIQHINDSL